MICRSEREDNMTDIIIEQINEKSIEKIKFKSDSDLRFLLKYNDFVYNVDYYSNNKFVFSNQVNVSVHVIGNDTILVNFNGFDKTDGSFNKAVISSIVASNNDEEITLTIKHAITYSL